VTHSFYNYTSECVSSYLSSGHHIRNILTGWRYN